MIPFTAWTLAALVLAAVAAELAARAGLRRRGRVYVHRPYARRDLHVATDVLPGLAPVARFRANADGERGAEVPRDPHGTERWCVAGGSAAECYMLDQDATWPSVLEAQLAEASARPVHVGNIARSLAPCRSLAALLDRALAHVEGLDGVVLMVGASDLVAWLEDGAPEAPREGPATGARRSGLDALADEHPDGPFRWSRPRGTALYRIARRLHARYARSIEVHARVGASIAGHRARRAAARDVRDEASDPTAMLTAYRRDLDALLDVVTSRAARVVVALQPWLDRPLDAEEEARLWNFGQGSPYRGRVDAYYTSRLVRELMERIEVATREVAERRGLETVALRGAVPSDFEHYYDFLHFTPAGARTVGAVIAAAIRSGARPGRRSSRSAA